MHTGDLCCMQCILCVCVLYIVPEKDEEEEEEDVGLSVDLCSESALQLTVTKSSLSIFTKLVQVSHTLHTPHSLHTHLTPNITHSLSLSNMLWLT